ncbi:MAG TPA: ABC transporter permease subunit [Candidatus Saccharimonadales bacterium]|nr:ABC transporter permease subunit [Candidatus Saccharimonadales bacterium]
MNWLAWQQHKKQFLLLGISLLVFTAIVIPSGLHYWHQYNQLLTNCDGVASCVQHGLGNTFSAEGNGQFYLLFHLVQIAVVASPVLLGLFLGVPLIANEYIDGTNKFIWTRSISRRKWLTVKLVWILGVSIIFASILAALATWWFRTSNALYTYGNDSALGILNRFGKLSFDVQGLTPIAYTFFMVSLGIAFGAWLKRILLAFGVTLAALVLLQGIIPNLIRPHYESPQTDNVTLVSAIHSANILSPPDPTGAGSSWAISGSVVNDKTGQSQSMDSLLSNPPATCVETLNRGPKQGFPCLQSLGYHWVVRYQPAHRYWNFQRIEAGLYVTLGLIPIGATYWLVLKRDA